MFTVLFLLLVLAQDPPGADTDASAQAVTRPAEVAEVSTAPGAAPVAQTRVICRREMATGSNRTRKVCRHEAVADHEREASRRWLNNTIDSLATPECATDSGASCPARQQ